MSLFITNTQKAPAQGVHTNTPPRKYIKENGITKLNPAYTAYTNEEQSRQITIVSSLAEVRQMEKDLGEPIVMAEAYIATTNIIQSDPEVSMAVGLSADALIENQGMIFTKYQIPLGLCNKLLGLAEYKLHFLIDDSGSMSYKSTGQETRWQEAKRNLKEMLEIIAYFPTKSIKISFLNRGNQILLERTGTPEAFLANAYRQIDSAFTPPPSGTTPFYERLLEGLHTQEPTSLYFFGDGVPNGGKPAQEKIKEVLTNRPDPELSPVTLITCSNDPRDTEWMREAEEVAPFCSEIDDYQAEKSEVQMDQGTTFPYTFGLFQACRLVGALNPEDLDALDESIPFTKWTLDNLCGIEGSIEEYQLYFQEFCAAQNRRKIESPLDRIKKDMPWGGCFQDFVSARDRKEIPLVQEYQRRINPTTLPSYDAASLIGKMKI